jgi:hypothetical protein
MRAGSQNLKPPPADGPAPPRPARAAEDARHTAHEAYVDTAHAGKKAGIKWVPCRHCRALALLACTLDWP